MVLEGIAVKGIGHDAIVVDRRGAVLVLVSGGTDSKCRNLGLKGVKAHSSRLDSTVAMTRHRPSSSLAAAPMAPSIHRAEGALPELFHRAGLGPCAGARHRHDARPGKRTVSAALRVIGLGEARDFARYHHVLSRARSSPQRPLLRRRGPSAERY
jgi:hypothetical protein